MENQTPQILLAPRLSPEQLEWHRKQANSLQYRKQTRRSLLGFGLLYLGEYLYLDPPDFVKELTTNLSDEHLRLLEVLGFRGSTKSTWASFALPLWAALEYPKLYPFILPISDSNKQASLNIAAIKNELEKNETIKQDYGRIQGEFVVDWELEEEGEEWQKQNIVLSTGVRILARSRGQKVRGIRHLQHRPKLAIVDDPEDGEWVRVKENRDKTERWLRTEVLGAMDARSGRTVVIGNLLHQDALLSRLKAPNSGFKVLEYPLLRPGSGTDWERCTWKAMFPTPESLKAKEVEMGPVAWNREMLMHIVAEEDQIIKPEDIHYYDECPPTEEGVGLGGVTVKEQLHADMIGHGGDLAISQKENADFTALVTGEVYRIENAPKIYIQPDPFNQRVTFSQFLSEVSMIPKRTPGSHLFFIEDVGYQKAAIQEMERAMLAVTGMRVSTDKRSRLQVVAPYIKNGTVLFPRHGCEELLGQLFNLGVESHDDLVDALVHLIQGLVNIGLDLPKISFVTL